MKKILIICLLMLGMFLPTFAEDFMKEALKSWFGYPIESVIKCWGFPTDEKTIAEHHLYYYNYSSSSYVPATNTRNGYVSTSYLNITFEVDKNNKIVSYEYKSNCAPNFYFTGKKYVNPDNDKWVQKKKIQKELKEEKHRLKVEQKNNK